MKRALKLWILVGALGLGIVGAAVVLLDPKKASPSAAALETTTVEERTIDDTIEVSGHLKARQEQEIRSPSAGLVRRVIVATNDRVRVGDPIAVLDGSEQEQALADLQFQIDQETFSGNQRKRALLEGKAAVLRRALDEMTLRAHLDGKISRLDLKAGDVLKAGDSYGRIIDVGSLVADVEVSEVDIPRVRIGQPVEFRFPALPGLVVRGKVASFPAEARINERGLTVLDAKLVIDAPPAELLPAYSFQAVLKVGDPRKVLVADSRAVTYVEGRPRVERRKDDGTWQIVLVEAEGFGSGFVRLVAGVGIGDVLKVPKAPTEGGF